jgi:pyruvate/2-oxoglutarate dehydrogenase complex dihydrolipoamide dehydrogenase (E3) component
VIGSVTIDMATVRRRKREMVERQIAKHLRIYKESGAELIMGNGRFLSAKTLEVKLNDGGTRVLAADKIFLNVGTHAAVPNVSGLSAAQPLTHIEALELDYLPQHLIVIGGGYSGLELAQAFRRFGSDVTIIESGPQLLAREDIDVSQEVRRVLVEEGIQVLVGAELLQVGGEWTNAATFASMEGWRQMRQMYGPSVSAPAVRNSRTSPKTIFESFVTISQEQIVAPTIG